MSDGLARSGSPAIARVTPPASGAARPPDPSERCRYGDRTLCSRLLAPGSHARHALTHSDADRGRPPHQAAPREPVRGHVATALLVDQHGGAERR